MNSIAHLCLNSRRSLLLTAVYAVAEHQNAHSDQDRREEKLRDAVPGEPVKVVEQEQQACANQKDRADGTLLAETVKWVRQSLAGALSLRGAKRIDGHIDPKRGNANPKSGLRTAAHSAVHARNEKYQENCEMNHAFAVLLVIESA